MFFVVTLSVLGIASGFFVLWKSSDHVVDRSLSLARHMGVSPFLIGALLIAILTSVPELIVGIVSIARGVPEIAVGNILGSNMCDISFVLLPPLFFVRKLSLGKGGRAGILFMLLVSSMTMMLFLSIGHMPRWSGPLLVVAYCFTLAALWYRKEIDVEEYKEELDVGPTVSYDMSFLVVHMALALGAGAVAVYSAEVLSKTLNIFAGTIGTLVFSLGTSIPEVVVGISAARRGATDFVLGSAIGSVVGQAMLVWGILTSLSPGGFDLTPFSNTMIFIVTMYGFLGYKIYKKASVSRSDAIILSLMFLVFYMVELRIFV